MSLLSTGIHTIPGLLSVHPCSMLATVDCHASLVCTCVHVCVCSACVCVLCVCVCVCCCLLTLLLAVICQVTPDCSLVTIQKIQFRRCLLLWRFMSDHIAAILIVQVLPVLITRMLPTLSPRTPLCNSFVYHLHPPVITLVLLYVLCM